MHWTRFIRVLLCTVVLASLPGCSKGPPQLQSGDRVTPMLHVPRPWLAGQKAAIFLVLETPSASETEPRHVRADEIPETAALRLQLTFHREEKTALGPPQALELVRGAGSQGEFEAGFGGIEVPAEATFARVRVEGSLGLPGVDFITIQKRVKIHSATP